MKTSALLRCVPAAVAAACLAGPAGATVMSWSFTVDANIVSAAHGGGDASGFVVTPTSVVWGDPGGSLDAAGGQSGLVFTDTPQSGTVDTGDAPQLLDILISHHNNPVSTKYAMLESGTAQVSFDLAALTPPAEAGDLAPIVFTFPFVFMETPNNPASGICADGSAVGAFGTGCRDIFAVTGPTGTQFGYNGETYLLSLVGQSAESGLSSDDCALAGLASGCFGLLTRESFVTQANFGFSIARVAEPRTLALFGLGVIGLAFGVSRRRAI